MALSPGRWQAIIWTNGGILIIQTSGTIFSEIVSESHVFLYNKMHLKMSVKWWKFCLGQKGLKQLSMHWTALYGKISRTIDILPWWHHQMGTFSALLVLCEGNPLVTVGFPSRKTVTPNFDASVDLRLNKRLSKRWRHRWIETPSHSLWRQCNV